MFDTALTRLTAFFYGARLRKKAQEASDRMEADAANYVAARYTRGNVAIQQRRIHNKEYSLDKAAAK